MTHSKALLKKKHSRSLLILNKLYKQELGSIPSSCFLCHTEIALTYGTVHRDIYVRIYNFFISLLLLVLLVLLLVQLDHIFLVQPKYQLLPRYMKLQTTRVSPFFSPNTLDFIFFCNCGIHILD